MVKFLLLLPLKVSQSCLSPLPFPEWIAMTPDLCMCVYMLRGCSYVTLTLSLFPLLGVCQAQTYVSFSFPFPPLKEAATVTHVHTERHAFPWHPLLVCVQGLCIPLLISKSKDKYLPPFLLSPLPHP